jgi:arginase
MSEVVLIGAPTDIGACALGASLGPDALRVAELARALRGWDLMVRDSGNLAGPINPQTGVVGGYRHLPEVVAWNHAVFSSVGEVLADGDLPVLMGGDHCLAIGSISAVAASCRMRGKRLMVLWFDAHADANTCLTSPSGNLHGMPVACLLGHGPEALIGLAGTPALQASQFNLLGVRSVDPAEKRFVHELGIAVYDMRYIDEFGVRETMLRVLQEVGQDTHIHVSLDMDGIDPGIAPGVSTPVRGGLDYREAQLCMEMIADTGKLGSLDVMELNPANDVRNQTANLAVDLIESLFGKTTLMRR